MNWNVLWFFKCIKRSGRFRTSLLTHRFNSQTLTSKPEPILFLLSHFSEDLPTSSVDIKIKSVETQKKQGYKRNRLTKPISKQGSVEFDNFIHLIPHGRWYAHSLLCDAFSGGLRITQDVVFEGLYFLWNWLFVLGNPWYSSSLIKSSMTSILMFKISSSNYI